MTMHTFEEVYNNGKTGTRAFVIQRVRVPGGWIYVLPTAHSDVFVPDPDHVSRVLELERECDSAREEVRQVREELRRVTEAYEKFERRMSPTDDDQCEEGT